METEGKKRTKNLDERLRTIATVLGAVLVPVVVAIVGQSYTAAIQSQQTRARFVELAIEILREDPTNGEEDPLRQWAVDVVNENSGTRLSQTARTALVQSRALPSDGRGMVDETFSALPIDEAKGEVTVEALSNCSDRSKRVTIQLAGHGPGESVPFANAVWSDRPTLRFDPAKTKILPTTLIDAIVDADPSDPCTMVILFRQGSQTLRMESLELRDKDGENFFTVPLQISPNK